MNRYARQEILSQVGANGQECLKNARILVIGAGGLACPALQYLVGAGVGHINIVDHDRVSLSNLHRQTLYREADIGLAKAEIAVQTLQKLNKDCVLEAVTSKLTPDNVDGLIKPFDIVLDCADSFAISYILSDACMLQQKALICASALGFSGYVGGFCANKPSLRAVFPDLPNKAATCDTAGILGSVVGTIGAVQAQMALAYIIHSTPSPIGQLVTVDLLTYKFGGFRFDNAPEPNALNPNIYEPNALGSNKDGSNKDGSNKDGSNATELNHKPLRFISPKSVNQDDFIVDLRSLDEAPHALMANIIRYKVADFKQRIPQPKAQQHVVLCCHSGVRSWQAARYLQHYWQGEISLIATMSIE